MIPWLVIGVISSGWWLLRISKSKESGHMEVSSKFHKALFRKSGAWSISIFFGLQSMLFYGTATWLPTILVSKGYTLSHAGLVVSITGFLGSAIGIAAPHYASKLKNMRMFLFWMGIMVALSFAALIFDSGWRLIIWLLISNVGLSVTFPLSLLLTVTRSIDAGETRSLSIMAQSIGYLMAAFAPGIVGAIFDSTLSWSAALLVPVALGIALAVVGYYAGKAEKIEI